MRERTARQDRELACPDACCRVGACPDAVRLQARGTLTSTGVDQRMAGSIEFPGGVVSQFVCACDGTADNSMRIFGDRGWISLGPRFWEATEATLARPAFGEAAGRGVGLIAKVPLDSGWLGGRYDERSRFAGVRERWSAEVIARRAALVQRVRALLPPQLPLARAALSFILAHREIATVIPAAKTPAQLAANPAAASSPLPDDLVAALHDLWTAELADDPLPW